MYFRDDEEDKTGASMTHTMFDDQQVSTFVGQWNCFPGPDTVVTVFIAHFSRVIHSAEIDRLTAL